ncbi:MAG: FtsX-like permease family protein [Pyrinomonadaceae bacterium]
MRGSVNIIGFNNYNWFVLLELKLVSRSLFARRRSLVKFTSAVAVAGLVAGVASLIIAQALARGFQTEMRDKLLANTPHIAVFREDGADIEDWRTITDKLKSADNVEQVLGFATERIFLVGLAFSNQAFLQTTELPGANRSDGVIGISVGNELAAKTGLQEGSDAEIFLLRNGTQTRRSRVAVVEIFKTGLFDFDSMAVRVSTADFAKLYGDEQFTPRSLNISVKDIYGSDEAARSIREIAGNEFRVIDWQEANGPLFAALSLEKKVAFAIILLIILIAVLNITTTLALLVNERRSDIAVLRTCGAKAKSLVLMFVLEGLLLGTIGVLGGTILGLLACWLANSNRLISLPADVYSIAYIPLRLAVGDVLIIAAVTSVLCLIATFYPAFAASRIKPMENFRIQ